MRTDKIPAGPADAILVLGVAELLAVRLPANPNDDKAGIVTQVEESTGRDLLVGGDIGPSVFSWWALPRGTVSLKNPPGAGAPAKSRPTRKIEDALKKHGWGGRFVK
jgi:uncharacterized protein involved in outer membrane biogenesis